MYILYIYKYFINIYISFNTCIFFLYVCVCVFSWLENQIWPVSRMHSLERKKFFRSDSCILQFSGDQKKAILQLWSIM